jgi:hypothetical protein
MHQTETNNSTALEAQAASVKMVTTVKAKRKTKGRSGVNRGHPRMCRGYSP